MIKTIEKYCKKIVKAARKKLPSLFKEESDAENIREYDWCGELTYEFKINDTKLDKKTTDNPATFTFTAKKLKQQTELKQNLKRKEVTARAKNVTKHLENALAEKADKLKELQEKGFLFCHDELDIVHVDWQGLIAQSGAIEITFFTYDK